MGARGGGGVAASAQRARQIDLGAVDRKKPMPSPRVAAGVTRIGGENSLVGALKDRFVKLLSSGTERGRGDALFLRQWPLQLLAVVPQLIDCGSVALRVLRADQTEDQQHEHQGVDDALAYPPLLLVLVRHLVGDMDDVLPQRDE